MRYIVEVEGTRRIVLVTHFSSLQDYAVLEVEAAYEWLSANVGPPFDAWSAFGEERRCDTPHFNSNGVLHESAALKVEIWIRFRMRHAVFKRFQQVFPSV